MDVSGLALDSRTIGAIRRFVSQNTSRNGLKELLLEAGANADRILPILVTSDMGSKQYKAMSVLLNEGFDTIYVDFDKSEADGIVLRMTRHLVGRKRDVLSLESLQELEDGLSKSCLSVAQITQSGGAAMLLENARDQSHAVQAREAVELLAKGLRRLSTDPAGAITVCTSACESICRVALERLGLRLPSGKQLPDYIGALCQQTDIEALARMNGEDSRRVFTSLRGLAQNTYQAAHQLGDRHAHGEDARDLSPFAADLLVGVCSSIAILVAGVLNRNELKATTAAPKQHE